MIVKPASMQLTDNSYLTNVSTRYDHVYRCSSLQQIYMNFAIQNITRMQDILGTNYANLIIFGLTMRKT